jgi:transposase InsO family protein
VFQARAFFAAHGITRIERIVTDNGSCYKAREFAKVLLGARHQRITPCTPRHNGKVERYNRILAEEFRYAREWTSETQRADALGVWNIHYNYCESTDHTPPPETGHQPAASTPGSPTSRPHTPRDTRIATTSPPAGEFRHRSHGVLTRDARSSVRFG